MRFGINTFSFTDTFLERDLPLLDHCTALGFDVVEITPTEPERFPARLVRQAARDLGLGLTVCFALPADRNPIDPDPAVRARSVDFSRRLVDLTVEAGAHIYCGANYCAWKYFTGKPRTADEWAWGVDCFRQVCEHAAPAGLTVAVETLNRFETYFLNTAADAVRFVEDVGLPNAKVHLDTFHLIREEDDFGEAIRGTGRHLGYMHACGSQRGVPGRDLVPWRTVLEAIRDTGYRDCITIESFHPDKAIAPLVGVWRRFADSPEQLATEGLAFLRAQVADVFGDD